MNRNSPTLGNFRASCGGRADRGRTIALAMLAGGRDGIGQLLYVSTGAEPAPVKVKSPMFHDPENARLDAA